MKSNDQYKENETERITITLGSQTNSTANQMEIRAGDICPQCGEAKIDYDGMLNLVCPKCGYTLAGCFT